MDGTFSKASLALGEGQGLLMAITQTLISGFACQLRRSRRPTAPSQEANLMNHAPRATSAWPKQSLLLFAATGLAD